MILNSAYIIITCPTKKHLSILIFVKSYFIFVFKYVWFSIFFICTTTFQVSKI